MALPRMPLRMNKCYFTFRIYNRGDFTPQDSDYREPLANRVYLPEMCVIGQLVGYRGFFRLQRTQTGDSNPSTGSAVFRPEILRRAAQQAGVPGIQKGDRIIQINETACDFNLIHVTPLSPYRGRHLLILVEFEVNRKQTESI